MSIKVCSLFDVKNHLDSDIVVSITNPDYFRLDFKHLHALYVKFEDTENPNDEELIQMEHSIKSILEFIKDSGATLDTNIAVHCHAGISRSSAVSWLILISLGMNYKDAFTLLFKQHPKIWPNTQVMRIGGELLFLEEEFFDFVIQANSEIAMSRQEYLGYGG